MTCVCAFQVNAFQNNAFQTCGGASTGGQKGAGRGKKKRERKKYEIDGKIVWATPEELPQMIAAVLQKAIPEEPKPKADKRKSAPTPMPATEAEPWQTVYRRIGDQFDQIIDGEARFAALQALAQAEALMRQWEAEDEADIEFIVLHTLH
jgi:hypothetical protein